MNDIVAVQKLLEKVVDPEIPVLTIMDMGIIRDIEFSENDLLTINISPTYTGCPAMDVITISIKAVLQDAGYKNVKVNLILSPPWTTDWITENGKEVLKKYGIAPPVGMANKLDLLSNDEVSVPCPRCNSTNTEMISHFGSTACKALYKCEACKEPFDYFKCH
jgi:ring-1,2-phenylacetyl-CoA epoxidase subunit PaaD